MKKTKKVILLLTITFVFASACDTKQNLKDGLLHVKKDIGEDKIEISSIPLVTDLKLDRSTTLNSTEFKIGIFGNNDDVLTRFEVENSNIDEIKKYIYIDENNQQCINIEDYRINTFKDLLSNLIERYGSPIHVYNDDVEEVRIRKDEILLLWNRTNAKDVYSKKGFDRETYKMIDKYNHTEFDEYQYIFEDKYLYFYKIYYASKIGTKKVTFIFHPQDSVPEVSDIKVNVSQK